MNSKDFEGFLRTLDGLSFSADTVQSSQGFTGLQSVLSKSQFTTLSLELVLPPDLLTELF